MGKQFKVGDVIRGTDDHYGITNKDMTKGLVIALMSDNEVTIEVVEHKHSKYVGQRHTVKSEYFEIV